MNPPELQASCFVASAALSPLCGEKTKKTQSVESCASGGLHFVLKDSNSFYDYIKKGFRRGLVTGRSGIQISDR